MNEIFDIKRFGLFLQESVKNNFLQFREIVLVSVASYLGICLAYWIFSSMEEGISKQASFIIMAIFFVIGVMRAPSILYGYTNHKKKGISYAMLPVSTLEKLTGMFLMVTIITPIILLSSFLIVDSLLALLTVKTYVFSYVLDQGFTLVTLYQLMLISTTFLFGNVVFSRSKISKTILSIVLFWVGLVTILILILVLFFDKDMALSLTYEDVENLVPALRVLAKTVIYSIPTIFLFFTYRQIKTQQY